MNHNGGAWPEHIRAEAKALYLAGYSPNVIQSKLRSQFPVHRTPSDMTIRRWAAAENWDDLRLERIRENEPGIALRADELVLAKLEYLAEHIDKARLSELMIASAIPRTKMTEREDRKRGTPMLPGGINIYQYIDQRRQERFRQLQAPEIEAEAKDASS